LSDRTYRSGCSASLAAPGLEALLVESCVGAESGESAFYLMVPFSALSAQVVID
jgi:hypothetical protein